MTTPVILFLASLAGLAIAFWPGMEDLLLLALPCALASLWLVIRALRQRPPKIAPGAGAGQRQQAQALPAPAPHPQRPFLLRRILRPKRWLVIDGSNVMHWKDGTPQLATVQEVVTFLLLDGFSLGVVFDANAGHKLFGRYQDDRHLSRLLGLPEDKVLVVPRGTPADPAILATARDLGARIVTNDRYRDWAEAHPEITTPGHLITGGYREGKLWLDFAPQAVRPAAAR